MSVTFQTEIGGYEIGCELVAEGGTELGVALCAIIDKLQQMTPNNRANIMAEVQYQLSKADAACIRRYPPVPEGLRRDVLLELIGKK